MPIAPDAIQSRFNKASSSYEEVAYAQRQAADVLIDKILKDKHYQPSTVLDLGAGTGYNVERLLSYFPECHYYLNDFSEQLVQLCKKKFLSMPNIHYILKDMCALDVEQRYHTVLSNLAFQWITNLEHIINLGYNKAMNVFAFSTLMKGTFSEWESLIQKYQKFQTLNYPHEEEILAMCKKLENKSKDFTYWTMDIPLSFDNPLAFAQYLQLLGAGAAYGKIEIKNFRKILRNEKQALKPCYKIFFALFRKQAK